MKPDWILFMDLDGTMWDHKDISATKPPFKLVGSLSIEDVNGTRINAFSEAVEFLKWSRTHGAYISSLSWNIEAIAKAGVEELGLTGLFDNLAIKDNPDKASLMEGVLKTLEDNGGSVSRDRLVYIDDRDIHIAGILKKFPGILFINIWKDAKSYGEAEELISNRFQIS